MITDEPRTLVIGGTGEVWSRIADRYGRDMTAVTVQLRTVSPSGTISSWAAPVAVDTSQAVSGVLRARMDHTATVAGMWEVQALVGTDIVKCGVFLVVDP